MTVGDLTAMLREDWIAHGRPLPFASAGFQTVLLYRVARWAGGLPAPLRVPVRLVCHVLSVLARNVYGIELPLDAEVGRAVVFAHQSGIVVGWGVRIGDGCLIRQNVTIGASLQSGGVPTLGDRVQVGAGAVLVGAITIGDGARIGPNAVVMKDVPAGASAFARPARVLKPVDEQRGTHIPADGKGRLRDVFRIVKTAADLDMELEPSTPLLSSGLVDSFALVSVVDELEDAFDVELPTDEIGVESFDTPEQVLAFIQSHRDDRRS